MIYHQFRNKSLFFNAMFLWVYRTVYPISRRTHVMKQRQNCTRQCAKASLSSVQCARQQHQNFSCPPFLSDSKWLSEPCSYGVCLMTIHWDNLREHVQETRVCLIKYRRFLKKVNSTKLPDAAGKIAIRFEDVYQLNAFPTPPMVYLYSKQVTFNSSKCR